jgi:hypothetical protein
VRPDDVAELMTARTVVDGRNLLDREQWINAGFRHVGIGR